MPYLGDYIGHLLSEVAKARAQADMESVRIAEYYASHPLLRNMPIPHFRLPKVDLDFSVAISGLEAADTPDTVLTDMRKRFGPILASHVKSANFKLSDEDKINLDKELDEKVLNLKKQPVRMKSILKKEKMSTELSVTTITDEFISAAVKAIEPQVEEEVDGPERLQKMKTDLKKALSVELSDYLHENTRLNVLTTSAELKEIGRGSEPSSIMANIRLSITEEAFEWAVAESEGETRKLLLPE